MSKAIALSGREDVSRFMVHLTRDDRKDYPRDGGTAKANLRSIISDRCIYAQAPHCTFNKELKKLPAKIADRFNTTCFTETPLNQLHLLVRDIPGRRIHLAPYGICFTKDFIVENGGQPALYINEYRDTWLRECVGKLYTTSVSAKQLTKPLWRILPFVNSMHEGYDFSWEREWRVLGNLRFASRDIVCVILPAVGEDQMKQRMAKQGIATISPGWTYEQIVGELAKQQRTVRSLAKAVE